MPLATAERRPFPIRDSSRLIEYNSGAVRPTRVGDGFISFSAED